MDRSRENLRQFTITDTFFVLVEKLDEVYCAPFVHVDNYMYPITGKIGIDEMVDTFVDLALFANLSAPAGGGGGGTSGKPPTMADDLIFITRLSFGATPKVLFIPFKSGLSVADASLATTFSRQDKHEVTVGLSLPVPPAGSHPTQLLITAQGGPSQQAAAQAVEQSILRNQLNRRSALIVVP